MAKKAYIGVGNVARRVKKIYIGVNGVARKVKKAYIGVNGVARLCFSSGELAYYGRVTPLSSARLNVQGASIGDLGLFGGGGATNIVDAYDANLTLLSAPRLSGVSMESRSAANSAYALYGGGVTQGILTDKVCAYNSSLSMTTPAALSGARYAHSATATDSRVLFGGGVDNDANIINTVDVYDTFLTHSNIYAFDNIGPCYYGAAASVGGYCFFGGGRHNSDYVQVYDPALTVVKPSVLSVGRQYVSATHTDGYVLFGGGMNSPVVDAYNTSLTRSSPTTLSFQDTKSIAVTVGEFAFFGGTYDTGLVNVYNSSLTRIIPTESHLYVVNYGVARAGNYALFASGKSVLNNRPTPDVQAYSVM